MMVRRMPRGDMAILSDGPPVNGHRPSADVLFHSVAQEFGLTAVGILMTGMGDDGAEGLGAVKAAGGMTVAQSEDTCVVSGLPRYFEKTISRFATWWWTIPSSRARISSK